MMPGTEAIIVTCTVHSADFLYIRLHASYTIFFLSRSRLAESMCIVAVKMGRDTEEDGRSRSKRNGGEKEICESSGEQTRFSICISRFPFFHRLFRFYFSGA